MGEKKILQKQIKYFYVFFNINTTCSKMESNPNSLNTYRTYNRETLCSCYDDLSFLLWLLLLWLILLLIVVILIINLIIIIIIVIIKVILLII